MPVLRSGLDWHTLRDVWYVNRVEVGAIIGDRDRKPAPFLVLGLPMIIDNVMIWGRFAVFKTKCAVECGTRACMLQGSLRMSRGGNGVPNSRILFYAFDPQLNRIVSAGFLLISVFVVSYSNLSEVRQSRIKVGPLITDRVVSRCFVWKSST